jgi:hypothetical protein
LNGLAGILTFKQLPKGCNFPGIAQVSLPSEQKNDPGFGGDDRHRTAEAASA